MTMQADLQSSISWKTMSVDRCFIHGIPAGDIIHMFGFHKDIWYKFTQTHICAMNIISNYVGLRTNVGVMISTEQDFSIKRKFSNTIRYHIEYIIALMCRLSGTI